MGEARRNGRSFDTFNSVIGPLGRAEYRNSFAFWGSSTCSLGSRGANLETIKSEMVQLNRERLRQCMRDRRSEFRGAARKAEQH